jgi:hypothetical protein
MASRSSVSVSVKLPLKGGVWCGTRVDKYCPARVEENYYRAREDKYCCCVYNRLCAEWECCSSAVGSVQI